MKHKALSIAILSLHCGLMANPTHPQVSNGDVSFDASTPGILNIQADDRSIINWQDFSIQAGEITQFIQPDCSSAVLNRVMGGNASSIMGSLQSNGKVYLINPNGVIFGKDSVVNTGALIASALDLPDQLFLQDGDLLFSGDSNAALVNFGAIQASNGDVILIGYQVENNGTIDAPNGVAAMAAGREVLIRPLAEERIYIRLRTTQEDMSGVGIDNAGDISALQAELKADGNSFAKAINHTGSIEATGIVDQGGRVYLVSSNGNMEIAGFIAAQDGQGNGGEVALLAQNIAMSPDALVNVDGGSSGNGGTVLFFADNAAIFYGTISAEGGEMGGDGGFVEVSGPSLDFSGKVSTYAPNGNTGTLLLDPYYIRISNDPTTTGTRFIDQIYNGLQAHPQPPPYTSTSNLNIGAIGIVGSLVDQLMNNNVIIEINQAIAGTPPVLPSPNPSAGNIDFLDPVIWNSGNSLTVTADNDLNIKQSIINMGTGSMKFTTKYGDINVGNPMVGVQIGSVGGDRTPTVTIDAAKNLNIKPGSMPDAFAQIGLDKAVVNCDIKVSAGSQLNLQKGTNTNCYAAIGHGGASKAATSLQGKITVILESVSSSGIILDGGSATGCHAIIGHFAETTAMGGVTIVGDIFLYTLKGSTQLTAGTGDNSFALIGHGGNSVAAGSNLSAKNIRLLSSGGDLTLKGGMGLGSGAFAAFGSTNGGNADPGNVTVNVSSLLEVSVTYPYSINLIAGNKPGNNASIGVLFNNTTTPNTINIVNLSINSLKDLTVTGSPEVTGSSGAFAIIGATSNPAGIAMRPMNVVDSDITLQVHGNFKLKAGLGAAKILTGDSIIKTGRNLSIQESNINNIANIIAGTAEASLFSTGRLDYSTGTINFLSSTSSSAKATSNGDITFITLGDLSLNNDTTGFQEASIVSNFGNASVQAANITMNPSSLIAGKGTVTVTATEGDLIIQEHSLDDSSIQNFGGKDTTLIAKRNIKIQESLISPGGSGTFTLMAENNLIIGDENNDLRTIVGQKQGKNSVSAGGNLKVIGGAGDAAFALLGCLGGGNIQYNITRVGGSVSVLGGSGRACFAQIGTNNTSGFFSTAGDITFSAVSGDVILTAGMGNISFAQIGSQSNIVNSKVEIRSTAGNVRLTPGVATNAFAQIGSRYFLGDDPGALNVFEKGIKRDPFSDPLQPPAKGAAPCGTFPYVAIQNVNCSPVP